MSINKTGVNIGSVRKTNEEKELTKKMPYGNIEIDLLWKGRIL